MSSNSYVLHEEGADHIRLLTLEYDGGSSFYDDRVIFRESSHEVVKILCTFDFGVA